MTDEGESSPARAHYGARRAALDAAMAELDARSGRISLFRGLTFLVGAGIGGYAMFRPVSLGAALTGSVCGAAFVVLVIWHALLHSERTRLEQRAAWIGRGLRRLDADVKGAPTGVACAPKSHAYAEDLDIFGEASLFQHLSAAETPLGEATLAAWLSGPAPLEAVLARQEAARELAGMHAFREDLALEGRRAQGDAPRGSGPDRLIAWASSAATTLASRLGVRAARGLVPLTLAAMIASSVAGASLGPLRWVWILGLFAGVALRLSLRPEVDPLVVGLTSREAPFGRYRVLLEQIEAASFSAPRAKELVASLRGDGGARASREMRSLERITGFADLRHNGVIHAIADITLLWDVWCAVALERWRARAGRHVEAWLAALGELEALASLGTNAFENPSHAWPLVVKGEPSVEARGLGHPLVPAASRVCNDVAIGGDSAPRALLVTGSNMSGKSTLLRALGANVVLALAGAPVCAASMRLTVLSVRTSMRISDSLEQGISHFYAELGRLKAIVDAANGGAEVLFLLDEIMHGTNSRERQIGAKAVIRHLVERGAIGAATSHDLGLAALEAESGGKVKNVHFEEHVEDGTMTFDYRLKPGPVTTANALRLMAMVGLPVPPADD